MPVGGNTSDAHSALVRLCIDYLQVQGAWVYKVHGGLGSRPGVPDLLCCLRGRLIGLECKTGRARLSAAQLVEADDLRRAGALALEIRRIDDLEDALLDAGLIPHRRLD